MESVAAHKFCGAYKGLALNPPHHMYEWPLFQMAHTTNPDDIYLA